MTSFYEENALSNDLAAAHKRTSSFSYRVPTPPRIVIPPPIASDSREFNIEKIVPPEDAQLDLSFLNSLDYTKLSEDANTLEWTYERRRDAQAILPFLYLGPMSKAKDRAFLQRESITMMLAVRPRQSGLTNAAFLAAKDLGLEVATIDAPTPQELIAMFPQAVKLINWHIHNTFARTHATGDPTLGKVFVFCESGNDKSAALVAAYITEMFDEVNHIKAMQICQSQRFCVNFDDTSKHLLQSYHDILVARRSVAQSRVIRLPSATLQNREAEPSGGRKQKRAVEEAYEDQSMEDVEILDIARFDGRTFSPYTDSYRA